MKTRISSTKQATQARVLRVMQGGDKFHGTALRPAQAGNIAEMVGLSVQQAAAALSLLETKGLVTQRMSRTDLGYPICTLWTITAAGMAAEIK